MKVIELNSINTFVLLTTEVAGTSADNAMRQRLNVFLAAHMPAVSADQTPEKQFGR